MSINPIGTPNNHSVPSQPVGEGNLQTPSIAAGQPQNDDQSGAVKTQPALESPETPSAGAKPDAAQAKPADSQSPTAASQVEVTTKDIMSDKLAELTKAIEARAALISSLPENIKNAVKDIFRQGALTENNLPEGLTNLLKSQNITVKQLAALANLLGDAARISTESQSGDKLAQLLEKLFLNKPNDPAANVGQKLADILAKLNNQEISPSQFRQTLQSLAGEVLAQNTHLSKNAQQLSQLLFNQNVAAMPPEVAKLNETIKQPDLTLLWTLIQTNQQGNKNVTLLEAQQKIMDLAAQLAKGQASPNQTQQLIRQTLSELLTPENLKLLEQGSLLKGLANPTGNNMPPHLAQMAQQANMPEFLELWALNQSLNANGGRNFTLAFTVKLEQNLNQLAANLLAGNMTSEEAKNSLDILMNSFKGFNRLGAEEENLSRNFLRQTTTSIPPHIQQAAVKYNMPEFSRAWLMAKLANLEAYQEQAAADLKLAANNIRSLSSIIQRSSVPPLVEHQPGNSVLSLTTPLYFGDGQAYPAHIHIYQEYGDGGSPAQKRKKPETWMRITLDTENIGPVDTFFRLYEQDKLDIRVRFQDPNTAVEFSDYLPEIRRTMKNSPLELTDLSVRSNN